MKLWGSICAAAVVIAVSPTAANAQDATETRGAYVALHVGAATVNDVNIAYFDEGGTFGGTGPQDSVAFSADLDSAFSFGGAVGYDFGMLRTDVEIEYSRNKVKALTLDSINGSAAVLTAADRAEVCDYLEADTCGGSGGTFNVDGSRLRQLSALANLWLDVPTGSIVTPYVGAGLGIAGYEFDGEGKARFAWQLGAGVALDVTPNISITADYRRRQTKGVTITDDDFPDAGLRIGKVRSNIFSAGLRFRF